MKVIDILKNYNNIKAEIKILESRILMLQQLLSLDDLSEYYQIDKSFFRKPLINRPTETQAIAGTDEQRKKLHNLAIKEINEEIIKLKSKKITKKNTISLLNIAFEAIEDIEQYIIKCIFFNKMTYENIKTNLQHHKKYKDIKTWCIQTIVNIKKRAIKKIEIIIGCYLDKDNTPCFG